MSKILIYRVDIRDLCDAHTSPFHTHRHAAIVRDSSHTAIDLCWVTNFGIGQWRLCVRGLESREREYGNIHKEREKEEGGGGKGEGERERKRERRWECP